MVDPWPRDSGNRNIAFNGQKMQTAVERYRTDRVIPPTSADHLGVRATGAPTAAGTPPAPPCAADRDAGRPMTAGSATELTSCASAAPQLRQPRPKWSSSPPTPSFEDRCARPSAPARRSASIVVRRGLPTAPMCRRSTAPPSWSPISMPATEAELQALETSGGADRRLAAGGRHHAELRRQRRAPADADAGRRFSGQAGAAGRTGAHLRPRRQAAGQRRDADRSADFHLPARRRRRRRHHARGADRDAAAQQRRARQDRDLPGRSRFPARRLRRLSRHRAAAQSQRDRAAAGAARPAIARSHAVAASVRPRRGRGAEPAGGNALVRSRRRDAAARSGVVAFRLCRVRHAAHLVLLDRQRAARLEQAVHRQRNDGARACARPSSWSTPSANGSATARSRRSSSIASCRRCFRRACAAAISSRRSATRSLACIPNDYGAGARSDRPRRAARRGQAGQQDHARAQEADRCRRPSKPAKEAAAPAKKLELSWARS